MNSHLNSTRFFNVFVSFRPPKTSEGGLPKEPRERRTEHRLIGCDFWVVTKTQHEASKDIPSVVSTETLNGLESPEKDFNKGLCILQNDRPKLLRNLRLVFLKGRNLDIFWKEHSIDSPLQNRRHAFRLSFHFGVHVVVPQAAEINFKAIFAKNFSKFIRPFTAHV